MSTEAELDSLIEDFEAAVISYQEERRGGDRDYAAAAAEEVRQARAALRKALRAAVGE